MTDTRLLVPEPEVKDALRQLGVDVPAGITHGDPDGLAAAADKLTPPLVLKAFGPELLHKTEVGAVQLGLRHDELGAAARQMTGRLRAAGLRPAGFLVEEQCRAGGIEMIVGLVERPPYGHLALLGLGGTLTEVINRGVTRLAPLSPDDVEEMLLAFPAAQRLRRGARGTPARPRRPGRPAGCGGRRCGTPRTVRIPAVGARMQPGAALRRGGNGTRCPPAPARTSASISGRGDRH